MNVERASCGFVSFVHALPTLHSIAAVSVVATAFKSHEIQELVRTHYLKFYTESIHFRNDARQKEFRELENHVLDKLDGVLPGLLLREEASRFTRPMAMQIFDWMHTVEKRYPTLYRCTRMEGSLCWTMHGTVDHERTLESLLAFEAEETLYDLYHMACYYCLVSHAFNLRLKFDEWYNLDDRIGKYLANDDDKYRYILCNWLLWCKVSSPDDPDCERLLYLSIKHGYTAAVRFFWPIVSEEVKQREIVDWAEQCVQEGVKLQLHLYRATNEYADIICFLLSQMNAQQQWETFHQWDSECLLEMLLDSWPWQEFFLPTLRHFWDSISVGSYTSLTVNFLLSGAKGAGELFQEIWQETPKEFKKDFISCLIEESSITLLGLIKVNDFRSLRLVLNDADRDETKEMLLSLLSGSRGKDALKVIFPGRVRFLQMLVQMVLTCEEKATSFKEQLVFVFGNSLCCDWLQVNNQKAFEAFKNWCFASEQQFDAFKKNTSGKIKTVTRLLRESDYGVIELYLGWSFGSDESLLRHFKKEFGACKESVTAILECRDWDQFEWFLDWCYDSEKETVKLKKEVLSVDDINLIMNGASFNRAFVESLRNWYFDSETDRHYQFFWMVLIGVLAVFIYQVFVL